ncbi:trafficking kinesin-binding protein 1-like isoform X2 [Mytilus galloprovincialis]|uniref:trafficking kinesin-binding protein 1-like isoform X2 n=1 Tax=Mytilus galloprovincialis TaxID=29158 RepID=UPI003F7BE84B
MDIPVLSLTSEELYCYGYSTDDQLQQLAVLCSDRLTQMTKTYNDIEAVNRLLEEKERDLELAARIGQTLLTKNQELETKNEGLEEHLSAVVDKVNQLKHEVILKDGLLQAFTEYEGGISPSDDSLSDDSLHSSGVKSLQKKCETLEQENVKLKLETAQLSADTYELEEKESKLVNDCLQQFVEVKKDLEHYVEELTKKTEENGAQKEEITNLLGQIVDLQRKVKVQTAENLELQKHLEASQNTQRFLTREISELKDKHDELVALYEDAQEEVRQVRRKQKPGAVRHNYMSSSLLSLPSDSLASELETSLKGDMEYPKGYSPTERKVHNWKVFETVKAAKKSGSRCSSIRSGSHLGASNYSLNDSIESAPVSNRSSMYFSDLESGPSDATASDLDGLYGTRHSLGRPGIPGSNDLETALRKLSLRRANELNEQDYKDEENKRHRQRSENENSTPGICQTPDSTLSTGSGLSGLSGMTGSSNPYYRLPEKLRIVKPLEGSVTLRQWQQLATPNIGGIFESRPGVQIKGERKLDLEEEQHNLSDLEEDDDCEHFPVRTAQDESWTINTYTNSVVRHPSCYLSTSTPLVCSPRMASQHAPNVGSIPVQGAGLGLASLLGASDLLPQNLNRENTEKTKTNNSNYTAGVTSGSYTDETHNLDKNFSVTDNRRVNCSTVPSSDRYIFHNQMKSVPSDVLHNKSETENFMSKIKNTGSSLYGFLGNWGQSSQTSTDVTTTNSSAIGTLPVSNMTDRATNDNSAGSNVTVMSTNDKSPTKSSMVSSIFGQRAGGSVLGALTSFQRSGIL